MTDQAKRQPQGPRPQGRCDNPCPCGLGDNFLPRTNPFFAKGAKEKEVGIPK